MPQNEKIMADSRSETKITPKSYGSSFYDFSLKFRRVVIRPVVGEAFLRAIYSSHANANVDSRNVFHQNLRRRIVVLFLKNVDKNLVFVHRKFSLYVTANKSEFIACRFVDYKNNLESTTKSISRLFVSAWMTHALNWKNISMPTETVEIKIQLTSRLFWTKN